MRTSFKVGLNRALEGCPDEALQTEILDLRDRTRVEGTNMKPYLILLRHIFNTIEVYVDQMDQPAQQAVPAEPEAVGLLLFLRGSTVPGRRRGQGQVAREAVAPMAMAPVGTSEYCTSSNAC